MATTFNLDYCGLLTISNDALYNYTKNQKVSSAYCKPFENTKEKTCREAQCTIYIPILNKVKDYNVPFFCPTQCSAATYLRVITAFKEKIF